MTTQTGYTYLSDIEAYRSGDSLTVQLKDRSVDVDFSRNADGVVINQADFDSLVSLDEVSLSSAERVELFEYLEQCAAE